MKQKIRALIYTAIAAVLAVALLEVGSLLLLRVSRLDAVRNDVLSKQTDQSGDIAPPMYVVHPYYGYVINPEYIKYLRQRDPGHPYIDRVPDVGPRGFFGKSDPVEAKNDGAMVVAVLGGSVACFEAAQGGDILVEALEKSCGRPVRLLNLALWAAKQPQQLLILNDLIAQGAHFDVVINLDGFNEMALPAAHGNIAQGVSPFFPQGWKSLVETGAADHGGATSLLILNARYCNSVLNRLEKPLLFSNTVKLFSVLHNKALNGLAEAMERKIRVSSASGEGDHRLSRDGRVFLGSAAPISPLDENYYAMLAEHWFRCSIMLNNLVERQCGLYFHFLQPNQYTKDKVLTEEEMANAFDAGGLYKKHVEKGYPVFRRYGEKLKQLGIRYVDLSRIFENTKESVYKDTCCHFNQAGVTAIARAIVERIAREACAARREPHFVPLCPASGTSAGAAFR